MTGTSPARGADYLDMAVRHSGRTLSRREEIAVLLAAAAAAPSLSGDFDRALFLAKFWEGGMGILRRTGPAVEDVQKLSGELSDAALRIQELLGRLFDAGAPGKSGEYRKRFLPGEGGTMEEFMILIADLALLKNYELRAARP